MDAKEQKNISEYLQYADCSKSEIQSVINLLESGKRSEGILRLKQHRSVLMNKVHEQQQKIDSLDYLIKMLGGK